MYIIGWKNLSYWLRGGIIGLIISIIFIFIVFAIGVISPMLKFPLLNILGPFQSLFYLVLVMPIEIALLSGMKNLTIPIIVTILIYFIIDSLIGLIIGKIKSKKE